MAIVSSEVSKEKLAVVHEEDQAQEGYSEEASCHAEPSRSRVSRPWKATFLRVRPLSGIFAIAVIICCVFGNLAILFTSNNAPISSWEYSPSTYLAITTAVVNLALRYACLQGLVIAWWSRASSGSTIKNLHRDWQSGSSFSGAISQGRHMGLLGLACIFVTLGAIDGPLLQRATKVVSVPWKDHPVNLNTSLVSEIPTGLTGFWFSFDMSNRGNRANTAFNRNVPSSSGNTTNNIAPIRSVDFTRNVRQAYFRDHPILGGVQGCPDVCKAKLHAPALAITSCSSELIPVNYSTPATPFNGNGIPFINHTAFVSALDLIVSGKQEVVNMVAGFSKTKDCVGTLNITACSLSSAIGEYGVTIRGEEIVLDPTGPTILALAENAPVDHTVSYTDGSLPIHNSTLSGIVGLGLEKYDSQAVYGGSGSFLFNGWPAQQFETGANSSDCYDWEDPLPDMLLSLNSLMFRTGVWVGMSMMPSELEGKLDPEATMNATVIGSLSGAHDVFQTNFRYLLAAALLEVISTLMVLPTFWGFWRLGRSHSFSPLEIAKAFDAPLLRDCDTTSSGENIAQSSLGATKVRYGAAGVMRQGSVASSITLMSSVDPEKICFAEAELVHRPSNRSNSSNIVV